MPSFPLISELPAMVTTDGWDWQRFNAPVAPSHNFWLGTDRNGNKWLTKLSGSFYAYREIVFARLAQAMNWSCQSSVFMLIDKFSAEILGVPRGEVHAAHWLLNEHQNPSCAEDCALEFLRDKQVKTLEDLMGSNIAHLLDWPKSEYAACLFGGNEPPW